MTQTNARAALTTTRTVTVQDIVELTPHMRRIVFSGKELEGFAYRPSQLGPYLKLRIPLLGRAPNPAATASLTAGRAACDDNNTVLRTYSVRHFEPESLRLTVDFVLHGDEGPASGWAARAVVGDTIGVLERGSRPAKDVDRFLILGDHTALPAIAQMLENMPTDSQGQAFVEVADPGEWQQIANRTKISLTWLYTSGGASRLAEKCVMPGSAERQIYVWAGAEADTARSIRKTVKTAWKLPPERYFIVNYWRRGFAEDVVSKISDD
jgi:NADPH-dependent ferric siderophore reductase